MTDKQRSGISLYLLISIEAQLTTLRDFMLVYMCHPVRGDRKSAVRLFNETMRKRKDEILKAILEDDQTDIDDLLRKIFENEGDE